MMAITERFKAVVGIDNPSGQEAEIRAMIGQTLKSMGVNDQTIDSAGNLLARVPGNASRETIMLSAHMDSVPPCNGIVPVDDIKDGRPIIRSEGRTILGADDKSGVAVILAVVEALAAEGFKSNHPLELLFSTQEEVGLLGAKAFDISQAKSEYCYVLDGEGQVGEIFNAGASQESIQITCHGKRSHAGIAPEEGISAIQMAAAICTQVPAGRLSETLTTNLGLIHGGEAMNVVPPVSTLRGEARGHDESDLSGLIDSYRKVCEAVEKRFEGSRIEFVNTRRYNSFVVDPQSAVVKRAEAACQKLGISPTVKPMNIGSDAHVLNHGGLPTVVLGMGFHYSHSLGEFIYCDELERVLALVKVLVA